MRGAALTVGLRFLGGALLAAGLLVSRADADAATSATEDWPKVNQSLLDKFLFSSSEATEQRLRRWEGPMVLDFYYAKGKDVVKQFVKEINGHQIMGRNQVYMLPPASMGSSADPFNFALGVSQDFFDLALQPRPELGTAAYQSHAKQTGCYAHQAEGGSGIITSGRIITRKDLTKDQMRDCLLRGLLITAGLGHTQDLAYRSQPLSKEEQSDAFKVLKLLYHPSVRAGMTRAEFSLARKA